MVVVAVVFVAAVVAFVTLAVARDVVVEQAYLYACMV